MLHAKIKVLHHEIHVANTTEVISPKNQESAESNRLTVR
jgi:hypothetical protein